MFATAKLQSYEKLQLSITMRAPVGDWRVMLKQLQELPGGKSEMISWPASGLASAIAQLWADLDKTYVKIVNQEDAADGC